MKSIKLFQLTLFSFVFAILLTNGIEAQSTQTIPLSKPNQPGKLVIQSVFADEIIIRAYDGKEVLVKYDGDDEDNEYNSKRGGLRRISTSGVGLEITEDNNEVSIKTSPNSHDLELEVLVPRKFSLKLSVTHGDVEVYGIDGEHDISTVNGDVEMQNISGSVVANSVNGDMEISFYKVTAGVPMSFTGVNGDIDIAFPENVKMYAKMKTEWGDVLTDFDMELDRSSSSEVSKGDGKYKVVVNKWVYGKVNGGTTEFLFKTLHGDISIRKNK